MIAHLTGIINKQRTGLITIDVHGVGYSVSVPLSVWESAKENEESRLHISSYIREDKFDLFGFTNLSDKILFEESIKISGVGPSLGLEICSVPRKMLLQAINEQDPVILTNIKGVGKKRAEKMLVDLRSMLENHPALFADAVMENGVMAEYDQDAVSALASLGYDHATSINKLKQVSKDLKTTEERVKAALQI